ncbi:MAG: hypothetical protein HC938_13140 [Nitrospira sp.]|nr:hypothetical protein [Nitrospira sp.]
MACSGDDNQPPSTPLASTGTPGAEESVGERLFLETRFAQAFKVSLDNGGDINNPNISDRVLDTVQTLGAPIDPGPFKGLSMNCRACHFVDDLLDVPRGGMRTYTDFARRSPLPARADGKTIAVRNSPPLVNAALDRPGGVLFHFDAEFNSMEELVAATFTGRNFGWLPGERAQAIAHIARVVRSDDGTDDLAKEFDGTPFRILFGGTDASIPEEFQLTSNSGLRSAPRPTRRCSMPSSKSSPPMSMVFSFLKPKTVERRSALHSMYSWRATGSHNHLIPTKLRSTTADVSCNS